MARRVVRGRSTSSSGVSITVSNEPPEYGPKGGKTYWHTLLLPAHAEFQVSGCTSCWQSDKDAVIFNDER